MSISQKDHPWCVNTHSGVKKKKKKKVPGAAVSKDAAACLLGHERSHYY